MMADSLPAANAHVTADQLVALFNRAFIESERTELIAGGSEPVYLPPTQTRLGQIIFRSDFVSSALHEVAHWCIAGERRRQLEDYGYWYQPDGRSAAQQKEFLAVEVKPQALEWLFSAACGLSFSVSMDNLTGQPGDTDIFRCAVVNQAQRYCEAPLPERAAKWLQCLETQYSRRQGVSPQDFVIENVG